MAHDPFTNRPTRSLSPDPLGVEEARTINGRSDWSARLRAFVETCPTTLPAPERLYEQNAAHLTDFVLPLVARRTLKRLLIASVRLHASASVRSEWDRLVSSLLELPDLALAEVLVRPEVVGLVAGAEANPDHADELVLWLGQVSVAAMVVHGRDLWPTRIARSGPETLALPAALRVGALAGPPGGASASDDGGPIIATVRAGEIELAGVDVCWRSQPRFGAAVGVSTRRDRWLERTFPDSY